MPQVTIYHNPRCSKSRQTLELIRSQNIEPNVVLYLDDSPTEADLTAIVQKLGMEPAELIRKKDAKTLELPETDNPQELVRQMVEHPKIIERPIVVVGNHARLGRPPEQVLEILPKK